MSAPRSREDQEASEREVGLIPAGAAGAIQHSGDYYVLDGDRNHKGFRPEWRPNFLTQEKDAQEPHQKGQVSKV